jgi:hypothetical protein
MRTLAASVLGFEAFIALFFGLASYGLHIAYGWQVAVVIGICAIALAGMLRRPWAYSAGWLLQFALLATGLMVTAMFALGVIFLALWWTALHYGAKADRIRAAQLAAIAAAEGTTAPAGDTAPAGAVDSAGVEGR